MTSELKPGHYNEEFVSGGPKIYAYKIVVLVTGIRKAGCKVWEITLIYSASRLVNFDIM